MKTVLLNAGAPEPSCGEQFLYALKITALVLLTYGLMVGDFALCLAIEYNVAKPIKNGYIDGGAILLGLFVLQVVCWGIAWCWGAPRREALRKAIVEKQLAQIRAVELADEEKDKEEERMMIEQRRMMMKS